MHFLVIRMICNYTIDECASVPQVADLGEYVYQSPAFLVKTFGLITITANIRASFRILEC